MTMDLQGKVIAVTGAASGIGRRIALECLEEGASVLAIDIRDAPDAEFSHGAEDRWLFCRCDVTSAPQVERAIEHGRARFGGIDGLVHSAYWTRPQPALETEEADWQRTLDVTLKGAYLLAKCCIPSMRERGGGVILPIASVHSLVGFRGFFAYQVAKAGLLGLVRSIAADYGPAVRCNALAPGAVDTPALRDAPPEMRRAIEEGAPLKRVGTAEEVARAAVFLLSDDSRFMTGATMVLDGGWTAV